ncbi:helix-turn-helix transcriptional regulator [Luteithermobacter gelatinilyticus]|uniref:helix-turn-helix transcriptional regulator n=1 Tax=Luteithermobacter gelatinilyticus TaxID=2582913 RepID=UPI001105EBAD|nr:WYL domain-containing protein [Luteithermobacter gelatinilyticus]
MAKTQLEDISQAQQERLFHIDFKLRFLGAVNRNDLTSRFGIKAAAATRDLSLYKELAPKNLDYDTKAKTYIQSDHFKPIFDYSQSQALTALCQGLGDDYVGTHRPLISAETPIQLNAPQMAILAKVSQAIYQKRVLQIQYRSLSSGATFREIVPFALVDNGLRWHVRAYDRKRERFTDFVINRIAKPRLLNESTIPANETKEADIQWNRIVEMHLVPHPRLQYPETVEYEYGMQDGMLKVNVRAAVAGYVLWRWNVDCSENHALTGAEYHLWLKNQQTLYGVENLVIAPGYEYMA